MLIFPCMVNQNSLPFTFINYSKNDNSIRLRRARRMPGFEFELAIKHKTFSPMRKNL